jgi:hypothetical protein
MYTSDYHRTTSPPAEYGGPAAAPGHGVQRIPEGNLKVGKLSRYVYNSTSKPSSLQSTQPPPNEAQAPERHTISEDRSAGSNLGARNLAALKDRAISKDLNDQEYSISKDPSDQEYSAHTAASRSSVEVIDTTNYRSRPVANKISVGHPRLQQRFGQLQFDKESSDRHMDTGYQRSTASIPARNNYLRTQLIAKQDWVEDIKEIDAGSELQANIELLQRNIAIMKKELSGLERQQQMHANKKFEILYRIEGTCYFDHPEWTQGEKSVVSRIPVKNLDLYLERNKNIVFVVYRDFCHVPPRTGSRNKLSSPLHIHESIHPVSRRLRKKLQMMLKHDWRYESMFLQLCRKGEIDAPYLFIYHHRTHWRDLLAQCSHTVRKQLKLLAFYVSENYGKEYMAADALFAKRKVSRDFIKYLVQPGDILISRSNGQYRGLVASSWPWDNTEIQAPVSQSTKNPAHGHHLRQPHLDPPESSVDSEVNHDTDFEFDSYIGTSDNKMRSTVEAVEHQKQDSLPQSFLRIQPRATLEEKDDGKTKGSDNEFEIRTWQWNFDGDFRRVKGDITLRLTESSVNDSKRVKEWNMHDLDVYPLRFAPQPLVQTLRQRGMMFWQCRKRCLVSYHESNAKTQDEVRISLFPRNSFRQNRG